MNFHPVDNFHRKNGRWKSWKNLESFEVCSLSGCLEGISTISTISIFGGKENEKAHFHDFHHPFKGVEEVEGVEMETTNSPAVRVRP